MTDTMKRLFLGMICFGAAMCASAQKHDLTKNGLFNHIDIGLTGGTCGFGFDISAPVTEWARVRAGAEFRPEKEYQANFGLEVARGLPLDINSERFTKLSKMMSGFTGYWPQAIVYMEGDLGMNNARFLVDIYPFKNNRHWYATVGFYYGTSTLIEAKNTPESMNTLTAVAIYNNMYKKALGKQNPIDFAAFGIQNPPEMTAYIEKLRNWGSMLNDENDKPILTEEKVQYEYDINGPFGPEHHKGEATLKSGKFSEYGISIPIGKFAHDIIAPEDIYYDYSEKLVQELPEMSASMQNLSINPNDDRYHYAKDSNGRYIKKGEIRYKKGEVMHKKGDDFYIVPDAENILRATAVANKFKPYIGIGYETHIFHDKRAKVGVDAGIMLWGGHPTVDVRTPSGVDAQGQKVYTTYDLTRDIYGMHQSLEDYCRAVKRYPVVPQISARFSYRLW